MSVGSVVRETWRRWIAAGGIFAAIAAVAVVPLDAVSAVFDPDVSGIAPSWPGYLAATALMILVAYPLAGAAIVHAVARPRGGIRPAYVAALPVLGALVAAAAVYVVAVAVGLVLLVVPGVFVAVRWSMYVPVIALERLSFRDALRRSNELVRGRTWSVLGTQVLVSVIALALVAVPAALLHSIGSVWSTFLANLAVDLIVLPLWSVAVFVLYDRLSRGGAGLVSPEP